MSHSLVAIPLFGTRVSPRFDCAAAVMVVEIDDAGCGNRRQIETADLAPHDRINKLLELGIDTVVCGGIDRWSAASLQLSNVKIYACNTGEAEAALQKLLAGSLPDNGFNQNGSQCGGAGRRGQQVNRLPAASCCRHRGRHGPLGRGKNE